MLRAQEMKEGKTNNIMDQLKAKAKASREASKV